MKRANAAGRDRRSPTPAALRKRAAIETLTEGIAADRIGLLYQPIVEPDGVRTVAVEALMRWREGPREPAIPELVVSAERSPVIFKLENWVLDRSFAAAADWAAAGLAGVRLQVNLSAREFHRADLVRRLSRRLDAHGVAPRAVGVEITETSAICDYDAVGAQMAALLDMGLELWLDDFGTGHSSLEWLGRLPAHGVKVPGALTSRMDDPRIRTIVARVIDLAHELGQLVIAEGVETEAQRDALGAAECDLLQGFLFHAPLPAAEVPGRARDGSASLGSS